MPPVALAAPVNSAGWEDSPQISPDGKSLYFSYFRVDPILFKSAGVLRVAGPIRPGWTTISPFDILGADIYVARWSGTAWETPQNLSPSVNRIDTHDGSQWVSQDGKRILFTNGDGCSEAPRGVYYSEWTGQSWTVPVLASSLGYPFQPGDGNPHLTLDEQTLFFDSAREGGYGNRDIWMSVRAGNKWQRPVNLGPSINTQWTEGSPFSLDGRTLYFDDQGAGTIFRSVLQEGLWSPREKVVTGIAGDPSLTLEGDLFFTAGTILKDSSGKVTGYDANIMVARKPGP